MLYVVSYELMHSSLRLVRVLREHHSLHHA
jgi:hypothetical protein